MDGYSIYEVDGVFRGEILWDERTLVIRLLLVRPAGKPEQSVNRLIRDLGNEIITKVAASEEEIWICHYPQSLTVFAGLKRLLA